VVRRSDANRGKGSGKSLCRYGALYSNDASARGAYGALIRFHLRTIKKNSPGALEGRKFSHLHDIRVAMRRMRAINRFFRGLPCAGRERELESILKLLCSELGEVRDMHAVAELMEKVRAMQDVDIEGHWRKCMRDIGKAMPELKKTIRGKEWRRCIRLADGLANRLSSTGGAADEAVMKSFAAAGIAKGFSRMETAAFCGTDQLNVEELHELRKRFRKLRYSVEICAPVLGGRMKRVESMFKKVTELLGGIHDADMSVALISQTSDAAACKAISGVLKARRKESLRALKVAMKKLKGEVKGRAMKKYLKGCC